MACLISNEKFLNLLKFLFLNSFVYFTFYIIFKHFKFREIMHLTSKFENLQYALH